MNIDNLSNHLRKFRLLLVRETIQVALQFTFQINQEIVNFSYEEQFMVISKSFKKISITFS